MHLRHFSGTLLICNYYYSLGGKIRFKIVLECITLQYLICGEF